MNQKSFSTSINSSSQSQSPSQSPTRNPHLSYSFIKKIETNLKTFIIYLILTFIILILGILMKYFIPYSKSRFKSSKFQLVLAYFNYNTSNISNISQYKYDHLIFYIKIAYFLNILLIIHLIVIFIYDDIKSRKILSKITIFLQVQRLKNCFFLKSSFVFLYFSYVFYPFLIKFISLSTIKVSADFIVVIISNFIISHLKTVVEHMEKSGFRKKIMKKYSIFYAFLMVFNNFSLFSSTWIMNSPIESLIGFIIGVSIVFTIGQIEYDSIINSFIYNQDLLISKNDSIGYDM